MNLSLASKIPEGLSGLELGLQKDRVVARGMLDLDRVKSKVPQGAGAGLLAFLSGAVPVELRGRFSSADGKGRVEVEEALVAGISLPPAVVAQIVSQSTRSAKRPQGFDILVPVPAALHRPPRPPRARGGRSSISSSRTPACRRPWEDLPRHMDLQAPVQYVKGIGPQKAEALAKVGVRTAEDLLLHLPMRYEDRRSFARVADLRPGMRVSVSGEIAVAGLRRARGA